MIPLIFWKIMMGIVHECTGIHTKVQICVAGHMLDEKVGMLMDFKDMKKALNAIIDKLDHQVLNEVLDFNTTAELLAKYFYDQLATKSTKQCTIKKSNAMGKPNQLCDVLS